MKAPFFNAAARCTVHHVDEDLDIATPEFGHNLLEVVDLKADMIPSYSSPNAIISEKMR
jgi:hypothetical protein